MNSISRSPISLEHMPLFGCQFLDPHLTVYYSNTGVQIIELLDLSTSTLPYMGLTNMQVGLSGAWSQWKSRENRVSNQGNTISFIASTNSGMYSSHIIRHSMLSL